MIRRLRPILMIAAVALLAGCATTRRFAAATDVHALLVSIRDDDRAAFEAHVDRPALEAQLQARLADHARRSNAPDAWKGVGLMLSGPLARAAGALLVRPDVFRAVAGYYGYRAEQPVPSAWALTAVLEPLPDGRVCATSRSSGACLLTFADEAGTWRLVGFEGSQAMLGAKGR